VLERAVDELAASTGFCGVAAVFRGLEAQFARPYGMANRADQVPNTIDTRFAIASGTKGPTALAVAALIEDGALALETSARSVLGACLPLIHDGVTVEHLLAHRSGIGDYLAQQNDVLGDVWVLPVPPQALDTVEGYVPALDGLAQQFAPGERFAYCDSNYVVLSLIAERVSGMPFPDLVRQRVCEPAGMCDTAFLRTDALPGRTAIGYLERGDPNQTNVFQIPVRGSGDGGIYTTAADFARFWCALFEGRIVSEPWVARLTTPRSETTHPALRHGLGFWSRRSTGASQLDGEDAGVSFISTHSPESRLTLTVLANTADGAWPIAALLRRFHQMDP
jgi:CubicO group peptidase (beta-lactamase class C family)